MALIRDWRMAACFAFFVIANASVFVAIRMAIGDYSPTHLALARFVVSSGVLALCAPFFKIRLPQKRDWLYLALNGFFGVFIYQTFLNLGEKTVTAGAAAFLVSTAPVWTAIFAFLTLEEKLDARQKQGIAISLGGAFLIAMGEKGGLAFSGGAILVLVAAVASGAYIVLQKHLLARYTPFELTAYTFWLATVMLLIFSPGIVETVRNASSRATLAMIYIGVIPGALANITWALIIHKTNASTAASWLYAVPLVSILMAWPLLHETPAAPALIGGALALIGVAIVNVKRPGVKPVVPLTELAE